MSQDLLDLEELVRLWVNDFASDNTFRRDIDDLDSNDINWNFVRVKHGKTEYYDQTTNQGPKKHVLSTCYFTNDTDQDQVFNLNTERRTTSVCTFSIERAYTIGYSVDIKLCPPNPVVEANAGFKGEMSVVNTNEQTVEEELVWSVNSEIKVPPKFRTKVDLEIKEEEYASKFRCETKFGGYVEVTLRNKKDKSINTTLRILARDLFRAEHGFRFDGTGIYFMSGGSCKSRFGIEQHVKVTQSPIAMN